MPTDPDAIRTPVAASGQLSRPRWRVMVVRVPARSAPSVREALPAPRALSAGELPFIARITHDQQVAARTAARLREAGAVVLVLEEPGGRGEDAFCRVHPDRIAARTCLYCTAAICTSCRQQAGDEDICPDCVSRGRGRRRTTRLRQLFALFLFAVFCYQVFAYFRHQQRVVSPGGPVRVAILQFSSPGDPLPHAARALNAVTGQGTSFEDIGPWLSAEHRRYGGKGSYAVDVLGPWGRTVEPPPLSAPGEGPLRAAWRSFQYPRYFHGLATDQGVDPDSYGGRIYVIYTDEMGDRARESRGSEKGRVAIAFVSSQEQNPAYAVLTVAHELGHVLGADDLYDMDTFRAVHPEGFVEPYAAPLYPQDFAELMAVDRPVGARTETEVRSLEEVRIGHRTAASFGWIRKEQADLFYQPPALSAQDRLRPSKGGEPVDERGTWAEGVGETTGMPDAGGAPSSPTWVPP